MYKMIYDSRHKSCIQSLVGLCLFYRQPIAKLNILHYRNLTTQLCGNLCVNVQCDKHNRRLYYLFGMFKGVAFHGVVSSLQYMVIINIIYIRSVITSYILVVLEVISWTFWVCGTWMAFTSYISVTILRYHTKVFSVLSTNHIRKATVATSNK